MDERQNRDDQFNRMKGKVSLRIEIVKLQNLLSQSQLDYVYRAQVESHLRYANVIWGSFPKTKLSTLQRLQDTARSIIDKARLKDSWSHNWLKFMEIVVVA